MSCVMRFRFAMSSPISRGEMNFLIASMMVRAIQARDYPLVQGGVLLIATTFVLVNLVVDLLYAVFDPRIRYE